MERYDLEIYHCGTGRYINGLKPDKDGMWVKHEEAVNLMAEIEQRLADAESRIAELVKGIQQAMEELTENGTCHETLQNLIEVE